MKYAVGIDLGGTNIAAGVVDETGKLLCSRTVKTKAPCTPDEIADRIAALCRAVTEDAGMVPEQIAWIGAGVPGSVDKNTGILEYANNLGFRDVPLGTMLGNRLQCPVFLDNDANAAAWAEYCVGAGKGCCDMVMMTLGTGVGGGIIEKGHIVAGCNWAAGELGHFVIERGGIPCSCGMCGCFEQYASVSALVRQTRKAMEKAPKSLMWKLAGNDEQNVNGRTAFDAMRQGDSEAKEVVDRYIYDLCIGVTSMINIFQPEVFCIGGGISREGETLIAPIRKYVKQYGYARGSKHQPRITAARLAGDAGIIGAALLGMQ